MYNEGVQTKKDLTEEKARVLEDLNNMFAPYFTEALDDIGSFYYTKESFDGTYPGYGSSYPDLRKTINTVQQNITDGVLNAPSVAVNSTSDWRIQMVSKFREGKTREARNIICKHATPDVYDEMFQFLYRNLDFFGANEDEQDQAVVIIRNGMVKHTMVADPEINFSATMIELEGIGK